MLFSFFFGAGNLIFPPMLGYTAQHHMWIAMAGFAITGILLPYITVIIVAHMNGGVESVGNKVHPIFGTIFAICIYPSGRYTVFHVRQMSLTKSERNIFYPYITKLR